MKVQAAGKPPVFPALDLLKSILKMESQTLAAFSSGAQLSTKAAGIQVDWEPMAAPESTRSWLYLNLSEERLGRLRTNVNEAGGPLF